MYITERMDAVFIAGNDLEVNIMFCSSCGKEINDQAVVCPYCGAKTANAQQIPQQPDFGAQQNYGAPQQNPYMNQYPQPIEADETNVGIVVVSVLFPIIGIILGAVNMSNGKKKSGKAYLMAGIIAFAVELVISIIIIAVVLSNPALRLAWFLS